MKRAFAALGLAAIPFVAGAAWAGGPPLPDAPSPVSPAGAIASPTPVFAWSRVPTATAYDVAVDDAGGRPVVRAAQGAARHCRARVCTLVSPVVLPGGAYTWRIQARNASGGGPWSAARSFTVVASGSVGAGFQHSLAVTPARTLWAWGENASGQLGLETASGVPIPTEVPGVGDVVAAAGGAGHTVLLEGDGTVWTAGANDLGSLGAGGGLFEPVPGLRGVVEIASGRAHVLALLGDGTVVAWGANASGQLGNGTFDPGPLPVAVPGLQGVVAVAAGAEHSLALTADGTVVAWGANASGELGDGGREARPTPAAVVGLSGIVRIASGPAARHSFAVGEDGAVFAWGANGAGQLGDGSLEDRSTPVAVSGLRGVIQLAAGGAHSLALGADGTIRAWGDNSRGQLGTGTTDPQAAPVALVSPTGVLAIASGFEHSLALTRDGRVLAWGANASGQVGSGAPDLLVDSAVALSGPGFGWTTATPVLTPPGGVFTAEVDVVVACATPGASIRYTTDGSEPTEASPRVASGDVVHVGAPLTLRLRAWSPGREPSAVVNARFGLRAADPGANPPPGRYAGRVLVGLYSPTSPAEIRCTTDESDPTDASPLCAGLLSLTTDTTLRARAFRAGWEPSAAVTLVYVVTPPVGEVAAGEDFSLALDPDGSLWTWGAGESGQLGDGQAAGSLEPVPLPALTDVVAAAAGRAHALAVRRDGTVWAWGDGAAGQTGDGSLGRRLSPAPVAGPTDAVAVAAGASHSLALRADGRVWSWGSNASGQLGDGTTADRAAPAPVPGLTGVVAIGAGAGHSLALTADGRVWSWGDDASGQVGSGSPDGRQLVPAVVADGAVSVAAGREHSLAVRADGSAWAWGRNDGRQLGDPESGVEARRPVPVRRGECGEGGCSAPPLDGVVRLAGGGRHSLGLLDDGALWAWGSDAFGQLGDGGAPLPSGPVQAVPGLGGVVSMAAGGGHSLALTATGEIWAWGRNDRGQVGDATSLDRSEPVLVVPAGPAWRLPRPSISPAGGRYPAALEVSLASRVASGVVRYTLDGSDPTEGSPLSVGPLTVATTTEVRARAFAAGYAPSLVAGAAYQLDYGTLSPPLLSPPPGTYVTSVGVVVSAPPGASVHYTTDGTAPTTSSPLYDGPVTLSASATLRATSFRPDWTPSVSADAAYEIRAATPIFTPAPGSYPSPPEVAIATSTPGARVTYTTDGREPTPADAELAPGGAIRVDRTLTLKARAFRPGATPSAVAEGAYALRTGALVARPTFSLAVVPDGTLYAWGANSYGQLGDGTLAGRTLPAAVSALEDVVALAAGESHTLAVTADGRAWAWGRNHAGQLGDGTRTSRLSPVPVAGLADVVAVSASGSASVALTRDGTLWTWGSNSDGQLGLGDTTDRLTPVAAMADVVEAAMGGRHCVVRRTDGTARAWGWNGGGQLGDGTTTRRLAPVPVSVGPVTRVQAGESHSVALRADGTVWGWGDNSHGQLGDGTTSPRAVPARVPGLLGVADVAAGADHTVVAGSDGTVWAWGRNDHGQLGDGGAESKASPARVPDLPGVVAVFAGAASSFAVSGDAAVWAWGRNGAGQLGDGTTRDRGRAVSLAAPAWAWRAGTPVFDHAPGTFGAELLLALSSASAGARIHYTLDGAEPTAASPAYAAPLPITRSTVVKARALLDGVPESNAEGGLVELKVVPPSFAPGDGTYSTPQAVVISTATPGATVRYTDDGRRPDESSPAYDGPLGIGARTTLLARAFREGWTASDLRVASYAFDLGTLAAPTFAPAAGTYPGPLLVSLAAGPGGTIRYTVDGTVPTSSSPAYSGPITLTERATVKAAAFRPDWTASGVASASYEIQLSPPTLSVPEGSYPVGQAATLASPDAGVLIRYTLDGTRPEATSTGVPSGTTLHLMRDLTLRAVAFKAGCLPSDEVAAAFTVSGALPQAFLAGGDAHSVALTADGVLWAWGDNASGRLGDGTTTGRLAPTRVTWPQAATRLAVGAGHGLAVDAAGGLHAWGYNGWGQLGDGTTTSRATPVPTGGLAPGAVAGIGGGQNHSLAVLSDGTVAAWGAGGNGQLGDGATGWRTSPAPVPGLADVVRVAAAATRSFAVRADGAVLAWGSNSSGQLGDGTKTQRLAPVAVGGLADATAVAAGSSHTLALTSAGLVYGWGNNAYGQLGDGTRSERLTPTLVPGLTGVAAVAAGTYHSLALRSDGTVWAWGYSVHGEVGDGTSADHLGPTLVAGVTGAVAIGAGAYHSLALGRDGTIWTWGYNSGGQLGDGSKQTRTRPVAIGAAGGAWNVAAPTLSYASGTYAYELDVVVSCGTPGATIRYTLTGSDPTEADPVVASGGIVHVGVGATLEARAFLAGQASEVSSATYTLALNPPTFSPAAGTYATDLDVTLGAVAGSTIRYTTDGSDPAESSPANAGPVRVSRSLVLKARALRAGWVPSGVGTQPYTMKVATPALSPGGGTFTEPVSVSVATATPGAVVRATLDGRDPSPDGSAVSGGQVSVSASTTLRARAWREGWTASDVAVASFGLTQGQAQAPTVDPPGGAYSHPLSVRLGGAPGAVVRYTLDGSDPTWRSPAYSLPLPIAETTTVKAKAWRADSLESAVVTAEYTLDLAQALMPRFSPGGGRTATRRLVGVSCPTPGSTVRYTLTGADPTTEDPEVACGGTIAVTRSAVLKARAWAAGLAPSAVRHAVYEIAGMVAAGGSHSLALDAEGRGWAWGANATGQLGDGATADRLVPFRLPAFGASPVGSLAAGKSHSLAVTEDGRVWAWGANTSGQLGDGTTTRRTSPVLLPAFSASPVVAVGAGEGHSLALTADGRVWAWGANTSGQVGDGTWANRTTPVLLAAFATAPVEAVAAGANHSVAVAADGRAWAWGYNGQGALGDGTTTSRNAPVAVVSLARVVEVAAGTHTLALTADGTVWAWGANVMGQLGDGTTASRSVPVRVPGLSRPLAIAAASSTSLAAALDGSAAGVLLAWGANAKGQLGDGSTASRAQPGRVGGLANAFSVAPGEQSVLALGLGLDGGVWAWGGNAFGQLGDGTRTDRGLPFPIAGLSLADNGFLTGDPDGDGLVTGIELRLGTDPFARDSNGDGIDDGTAARGGRSATDPDVDGDGAANGDEISAGTDPFDPDTDGDGVIDGQDAFPLDPTRSTGPPDPTDHTPPGVELSQPAGARAIP